MAAREQDARIYAANALFPCNITYAGQRRFHNSTRACQPRQLAAVLPSRSALSSPYPENRILLLFWLVLVRLTPVPRLDTGRLSRHVALLLV